METKNDTPEVSNTSSSANAIEIVPAILRRTLEKITEDWEKVHTVAEHIQIDITDGIFAGDGTFRELRFFKRLENSRKIELHLMVHTPSNFVDDIIDLNPARCIFHLESFSGTGDLRMVYEKLRSATDTELALALNPASPNERLAEYTNIIDFVLFMAYDPGWAGQPVNPLVFNKIREWRKLHPDMPISVDGHVGKSTVEEFVQAGATILCANTSIFGQGDPIENYHQLQLLAQAAAT